MPNSAAYRAIAIEIQSVIDSLATEVKVVDDPVPHDTVKGGKLEGTINRALDESESGIRSSVNGLNAMIQECRLREQKCRDYETALAAYQRDLVRFQQESAAHSQASSAYERAGGAQQSGPVGVIPPPGSPPRPALSEPPKPPYWSA